MELSSQAYAIVGLSAIVAAIAATVVFAVLRLVAAARDSRRHRGKDADTAIMSAALTQAVEKLKAQERAMAARAEASERMSVEITSSLSSGLLVVARNGNVRILNPAGRRMLRLADSAPLDDYHQLLREPKLSGIIDECFETKQPILRRSVHLPESAHGVTDLGVTVSPMKDEGGDLYGAICLFTDLTAVKHLEEQLRLKESLATVGELTAGIAHEFRNGLATIHGYSKLFDLGALTDTHRQYVSGIRAEAQSLSEVVTNFLNFAKPARLTLTHVDMSAICERAAEEVRTEARNFGGDITVRGTWAAVEGDEVLLRQAFSNLLRNAVEACVDERLAPVVVVRSEVDPVHRVMRVTVDDNGPGVPPAQRERVFQPFFTAKRNGTGLGLALVQKIIVFHNGRIAIGTSELGGASLQVTLPVIT